MPAANVTVRKWADSLSQKRVDRTSQTGTPCVCIQQEGLAAAHLGLAEVVEKHTEVCFAWRKVESAMHTVDIKCYNVHLRACA